MRLCKTVCKRGKPRKNQSAFVSGDAGDGRMAFLKDRGMILMQLMIGFGRRVGATL